MILWGHEQFRTASGKKFDEKELMNIISDWEKVLSTLSG
jgi:hypothetical protein